MIAWNDEIWLRRSPDAASFRIAIVGCGFTGAAATIALLDRLQIGFQLILIDRSSRLGCGLAYTTDAPEHLMNVRAGDLTIRQAEPGDFANWLCARLERPTPFAAKDVAQRFLPRKVFGDYIEHRLNKAMMARNDVAIARVYDDAIRITADGRERFRVHLAASPSIEAEAVMMATGYGTPQQTMRLGLAPYPPTDAQLVTSAQDVLLVGSGLTMVDVFMSLRANGFRGTATAISRHGQLPRSHTIDRTERIRSRFAIAAPLTEHFRCLREAVCEVEKDGRPWQAVVNGARSQVSQLWRSLSPEEQRRFLRHGRALWSVHRHRLPPRTHDLLQRELAAGTLHVKTGRVLQVESIPRGGFHAVAQMRGCDQPLSEEYDLAFDCSGFAPSLDAPLLRNMIADDMVMPDLHGLGVRVDEAGHIVRPEGGGIWPLLFGLGPLGTGTLLEITGAPEIVDQATRAAGRLSYELQRLLC